MERDVARARGDIRSADQARTDNWVQLARFYLGSAQRGNIGLGAVGDPAQITGEARWHFEIQIAQELVSIFAISLRMKELNAPAIELEVPASRCG